MTLAAVLAVIAVAVVVFVHVRDDHSGQYSSPCTISWTEDGVTFCEMTPEAGARERAAG